MQIVKTVSKKKKKENDVRVPKSFVLFLDKAFWHSYVISHVLNPSFIVTKVVRGQPMIIKTFIEPFCKISGRISSQDNLLSWQKRRRIFYLEFDLTTMMTYQIGRMFSLDPLSHCKEKRSKRVARQGFAS